MRRVTAVCGGVEVIREVFPSDDEAEGYWEALQGETGERLMSAVPDTYAVIAYEELFVDTWVTRARRVLMR